MLFISRLRYCAPMRQRAWAWVILAALLVQVSTARGQSTAQVLKEELQQFKQQHEDAST